HALAETAVLEPCTEMAREPLEVGEAHRLAHAMEGRAIGVAAYALFEKLDERAVLVRVDVRRYAARIALQPDALQVPSYRAGFRPILTTIGAARHPAPMAP